MAVNRSYRILDRLLIARRQLLIVAASLFILNSCLLSFAFAFPAQQRRRSMTIMDRLIGVNPLRGFPSLGVQIPFQIYYPQQQSPQQQPVAAQAPAGAGFSNSANYLQNQQLRRPLQPQAQPQTIQPVYYNAQPETIFAPFPQQYQFQHQTNLQKLPPRRPTFFRRGFRFPVPNPNYYRPRPMAINPYLQSAALQQQTAELTERVKQAAVLKTHVDLAPLLKSLNTSGITVTTPTVGKSRNAHSQNEESYVKSSGSSNLVRVLVIRPSDLERMRNAGQMNISPKDFMKGYTIKYLAADGKQMVITTQTLPQSSESIHPTTNDQNVTCIEPFCDPFLRQLIPELMTSPPPNTNNEPIVIIKNSNDTRSIYTNIRNQKQRGNKALFDIVNSVDVTLPVEEIQAEYDPLIAAPSQVKPRVHFPGKDLSAKINSNVTSSRKYYYNPPKLR